jgi:hypothetical protein
VNNKYSAANDRESGYAIQLEISSLDKKYRKIRYIYYLGGLAYNNKYRKMLSNRDKQYVSLGTIYFSYHLSGKGMLTPSFISLKLLKLPLLGIDVSSILTYASLFEDKKDCEKLVRDISKHKQEIQKAPACGWIKSIDSIKVIKAYRSIDPVNN